MTAAEHLDKAAKLLDDVSAANGADDQLSIVEMGLEAIGHALAAIAIELGVPRPVQPAAEAAGV